MAKVFWSVWLILDIGTKNFYCFHAFKNSHTKIFFRGGASLLKKKHIYLGNVFF